ncbi:hypothetical protein BD410DRAFT_727573, partial [Rickenella mellea]
MDVALSPNGDKSKLVELAALIQTFNSLQNPPSLSIQLQETIFQLAVSLDSILSPPVNSPSAPTASTTTPAPPFISYKHGEPSIIFGDRSTRLTKLECVYYHPRGSHVEYPISSATGHIGHVFAVDPKAADSMHPRMNLSYGLGPPKGAHYDVTCDLLRDVFGTPVLCNSEHATCQGVRICEHSDMASRSKPHMSASRKDLQERLTEDAHNVSAHTAQQQLFRKTIALKAALEQSRCGCQIDEPTEMSESEREAWDSWAETQQLARRGQPLPHQCQGQLVFDRDFRGRPHYTRVQEVDVGYLEALFEGNESELDRIEGEAQSMGWGPRTPCRTVANSNSAMAYCPCQHRRDDRPGDIVRGKMVKMKCTARFQIFTPNNLVLCPRIAIIASGTHCHPIPLPTKTPPVVENIILQLLEAIGLDLADATPRRFMRHAVVRAKLKQLLPHLPSPTLADLHVSLANKDHLRVYVDRMKDCHFPLGTDWKGAGIFALLHAHTSDINQGLLDLKLREEKELKPEDQYIRIVTETEAPDEEDGGSKPLRLVVCMTPSNSQRLLSAQFIQSDIAFKRAAGYLEFELVGWDRQNYVATTFCRAFVSRQTAEAHRRLFHAIDDVVEQDTGSRLKWRHLDSSSPEEMVGILQWTADQHLGQANGIGLYLCDIAGKHGAKQDLHEPLRSLPSLSGHDHLRRLFRLCTVHAKRNIKTSKVNESVKAHMRSLICVTHDDMAGTIELIRREGGKVGSDWINDKIRNGFAIPALCWEQSFIPKDVWLAGDSNTNITEAAHADVNREGTGCTLLGAVVRGREFDIQKDRVLRTIQQEGIGPRYVPRNDFFRTVKSLKRNQDGRLKALRNDDSKIAAANASLAAATESLRAEESRL